MNLNEKSAGNQRLAKITSTVWTIIYCFAFPFLLLKAIGSDSLLTSPLMIHKQAIIIIFLDYIAALIIPLCLYLMWNSYTKGSYNRCHLFGVLPFIFFILYIFLRVQLFYLFLQKAADTATH